MITSQLPSGSRKEGTNMIQSFFTVVTLLILSFSTGRALLTGQQKSGTPRQPILAVEIVDGRQRIPMPVFWPPSEGGLAVMGTTKPLADWKKTDDGPPLTGIRINGIMEGDAVRIKITAVLDDSYPVDAPGPKYGRTEKPLGSYLAREGETVKVNELTAYGFEPLVLKVVKTVPPVEEPRVDFTPPEVINNLKSVEVVTFVPEPSLSNHYQLTVRNVSAKNIIALDLYQPMERGRSAVTSLSGDPSRPVMKPGETHREMLAETRGSQRTAQGLVPEPLSHKFIVGTVVFDDETYEGETDTAMTIIATRTGNRVQLTRAVSLLQKVLEAGEQDPAAMLERLRSEVSGLRIDVEPQLVDAFIARFPELPKTYNRTNVTQNVMRGLIDGRQNVLSRIKDIADASGRDQPSISAVWQRLNSLKEQLENETRPVRQASLVGG
jgi:hypothetical protein